MTAGIEFLVEALVGMESFESLDRLVSFFQALFTAGTMLQSDCTMYERIKMSLVQKHDASDMISDSCTLRARSREQSDERRSFYNYLDKLK